MRTLDAIELIERCRHPRQADEEWLAEHRDELDDLTYQNYQGRVEAEVQGCIFGSRKETI